MDHRDGIFAIVALLLSSLALAAVLFTDEYQRAAGAEAHGYAALERQVSGDAPMLCLNDVVQQAGAVGASASVHKPVLQ
ncbi:MAG TPA: hypothetical protein VGP06_12925 [Janthinobacterium sp.]|jgi:hypothetical protein|nr:hypothetical protein [Janthinobacterium sp.]